MPLERQVITMPLAQGVDTKTDNKQVVAGKLLELENGIFTRLKSIQKRNGYTALGKVIGNRADVGAEILPALWFRLTDSSSPAVNSGSAFPSATLVPVGNTNVTWSQPFTDPPVAGRFTNTLKVNEYQSGVGGCTSADPLANASEMTTLVWVDLPTWPTTLSVSSRIFGRGSYTFPGSGTAQFGFFYPTVSPYEGRGVIRINDGSGAQTLETGYLDGGAFSLAVIAGHTSLWALTYKAGVLKARVYVSGTALPYTATSSAVPGGLIVPSTDIISVGAYSGADPCEAPPGNVTGVYYSDFRVYTVALDDTQLDALWAASIV